ncbi:unnamed protein product [Aureobasidium uvarum]|uniref:Uncharacterized protein n=1 Tax=Aureobasidium uvarum TaxID=2773716 RepID=A0A9N8KZK5_9PEZI|nr:unnamed protein product [Aureobasidium uvarum]
MSFIRQNHSGSIRPLLYFRPTSLYHSAKSIHDYSRAALLSNHPELVDDATRKRILEQYTNQCASLGVKQVTELRKIRLPRIHLEQFVRLRYDTIAVSFLENGHSGKLARQYKECEQWLENNEAKVEELYEVARNAMLSQFPKLAIAAMRENILKQYNMEYERVLVPKNQQDTAEQPREFVAGTTHEEKHRFCELALQYVVIHLIDTPITSKDALENWKADFRRCQDSLAQATDFTIEEERAEALATYPDIKDPDVCRRVIDECNVRAMELREAEEQGVRIPSDQIPPKEVERFLLLRLESLAIEALSPGSESVERRKKRYQVRKECLANLDIVRAQKKRGSRWIIIPNPLTVLEWIGIGL